MKYKILLILIPLLLTNVGMAKEKKGVVKEKKTETINYRHTNPVLLEGEKLDDYRYLYNNDIYFWDSRSKDENRTYKYGKMTDEQYKKLNKDMLEYHSKYEYKTRTGYHMINYIASHISLKKNWGYEGEIERDDVTSESINSSRRRNQYQIPGIIKDMELFTNEQGVGIDRRYDPYDKAFDRSGVWDLIPVGTYYDSSRDYWFMPSILRNGVHNYYIGTDFSIVHANLFPTNLRVWYDVKHFNARESFGIVYNDAVKVYNPEAPFIYVYDADEYRKASSDWALHDRMVYGTEDDYEDDLESPFERMFNKKKQESMSRFTYGPMIADPDDTVNVSARIFIHLRAELAKEYLAANVHPAPEMNFKEWDYKYKAGKINYKESVIYPGLNEFDDIDRYAYKSSIIQFMGKVDNMDIYSYWAGIYKSSNFIIRELDIYKKAMANYVKTGSKSELKKAQQAVRRYNMMEAFRERYESKAMAKAPGVTKEADLKEYYSDNRLSIGVWSGSTGAGKRKHRYDPGLKTAIPCFEGADKPGNMGFIDGTKKEIVLRVLNLNGVIDIMLKDWKYPFDHTALIDIEYKGYSHDTQLYYWALRYDDGKGHFTSKKNWDYRTRSAGMPDPFDGTTNYYGGSADRGTKNYEMIAVRDKRWKIVTSNPGTTVESVPKGVITNTGGLLFGGYINAPSDIAELKQQYGSMRGAWNSALKGPYMIVSSRTYNRLGHSYFEQKAGHKLFKAEVTGAMIDASARTTLKIKAKDPVFESLMSDPYFGSNSGTVAVPKIDYNKFKGLFYEIGNEELRGLDAPWLNETELLKDVKAALAKDEAAFPGCSILRSSYIINPDFTKGLMFLREQLLETDEAERLYINRRTPYETTIKGLQLGTLAKEFPSFVGNPNLFLAYYKNIKKINDMMRKHLFKTRRSYDQEKDFMWAGFCGGVYATYGLSFTPLYHGIYGDYPVAQYTSDPENSQIESIMSRYINPTYERSYLETKLDRKVKAISHNNAQSIAYMSQARIARLDEKTQKAFNFVYRNPISGWNVTKNDDDYLQDFTISIGQSVPRMLNLEDENLFLQDLGWQRAFHNNDLAVVARFERMFPGMIHRRDTAKLYEYTNYSVQKVYSKKYQYSKLNPTLVSALYSNDSEPGLLSETFLRMNWDNEKYKEKPKPY